MRRPDCTTLAFACALALATTAAYGAEVGHYNPGVPNIRDFAMPEPGFYGVLYTYFYSSDRLNDADGDKVDTVTIRRRGGSDVTLDIDVNVDVSAVAPTFIWVSKWKILGAKYGAYIAPSFANTSVGAALAIQTGRGINANASHLDVGDLFVQPLWLGWGLPHFDLALGYGFYAPIGHYDTETATLPGGATVTAESPKNIGLGFWTHQMQGAGTWYPWTNKGTAVTLGLTYEIHHDKNDFDLTPGQNLTVNWGISQFLPLRKANDLLLELGPAGYSSWQTTDDSGSDATNRVRDEVHAAGAQLGLTYVPWVASLSVHYFGEFAAMDRFEGEVFGVSAVKRF